MGGWRAAVSRSFVEVDCRLPASSRFDGSFVAFSSDGCGLATLQASCHSASRSRACISRTGDDFSMLFLQRAGVMAVEVAGQEIEIRPGDFFFYDATMPHRLSFGGPFEHIALRLPRKLVNQRWRSLGSRGSFQLTPRESLCRIAAAALEAAAANLRRLSPEDLSIALENIIDLFSAGASKGRAEGGARGREPVPFARARAIIQPRLKDETLCPDVIAAAMRISRRSLNKLFERQGIGVMEYVILERLEQAARDLASPSQRDLAISEIAYRWGFTNTSHFCKRFRQHFGRAPNEVRRD
ncbi:helix-turn-helix domain-containing protein [Bradyrhizobium symbiodeficiens]|uniref:Helix-turn-helix domain-containing protein n=1 Tax=Bradyrhizobium symbiodeficiens TaxID=1404367 RepID=A0ABX5W4I1_9BRAD|nr:helix-turn-helix domain-containing protein [Bradyrhizobium symbiodeficiens]